jgi:nucleotide-binding universal stress UspA family protein
LLVVSAYRSVLDVDPAGSGTSGSDLDLESDGEPHFDKQAREATREAAGAAAAEARELYVGLEVAAQVVEGRPAQALVRQADGAALLVVGTPASGGFAGLQLGSVPHAVLHASPVPVAVVPSGDRS